MDYNSLSTISNRIGFSRGFSLDDMVDYAADNYLSLVGFFDKEDNPNIVKEAFFKPANFDVIIDYIEDSISEGGYALIRCAEDEGEDVIRFANKLYSEIIAQLPVYSLPEILAKPRDRVTEEEIHALGKGYDPKLQAEIQGFLNSLVKNNNTTTDHKKAAIIAIGYISDPINFNPILQQFTQDPNAEVAALAHSMLQAGHTVLNRSL